MAATMGHAQLMQYLCECWKDGVNTKDKDGISPTFQAVINSHVNVLEVLKEAGADVNAVTRRGQTVLDIANEKNDSKVLAFVKAWMWEAAPKGHNPAGSAACAVS